MHLFDCRNRLQATRDIRLVGDHDKHKTSALQLFQTRNCIGQNFKFIHGPGGSWLTVGDECPIEDAVPVQKDCPRSSFNHRTNSHLVCACLSAGWETNKCQTIAWKTSACGVP